MKARSLILSGALACTGCTDPDPMNAQARYEAFERSDFFEDGRAMRPRVPDTVPREWRARVVPGGETGLLPDGGWVQSVPLPLTRALLEQGRSRYETFCAVCHGLDGSGDSVVGRNMPSRRPPSLVAPHDHAVQVVYGAVEEQGPYPRQFPLPPGEGQGEGTGANGLSPRQSPLPLGEGQGEGRPTGAPPPLAATDPAVEAARAVAGDGEDSVSLAGRSGTSEKGELPHPLGYYFTVMTQGYGLMPSYAEELSPRERWAVVAWLRVLARSQRAPLESAPQDIQQQLLQQREELKP